MTQPRFPAHDLDGDSALDEAAGVRTVGVVEVDGLGEVALGPAVGDAQVAGEGSAAAMQD